MTEFLTEIPRWVTNLAFWIALLTMLACTWGVHRSFKGSREQLNEALDELYTRLRELPQTQDTPVRPPTGPLRASDNVVDIPTTRTAVARTDEAVEGLKATLGMPTDPNKLTAVGPKPLTPGDDDMALTFPETVTAVPTATGLNTSVPKTHAIPAARPDDPGHIADTITPDTWAYVLAPNHKLEHIDGHTIPAFRDPDDTPTPDQLIAPTSPDLAAQPGQRLAGATRLDPITVGGRHRHPEDDA